MRKLPHAPLQAHPQQLLRLDGELHRQLAEDLLAEAVDDHADRVLRLEDAARVFPGDRAAGLDLRPTDFAVAATASTALGDEVVNPALTFLVAGIPVLHRGILDL